MNPIRNLIPVILQPKIRLCSMDMKKAKLMLLMLLCSVMAAFAGNENEKEMGTDKTNSTVPAWEFIYSVAQPTEQQLDQISGNEEFSKQTSFLFNQLKGLCVKRIEF